MVVVEPIRNRDDVQLMIEWLTLHSAVKESDRQRNLMLFLSGVNLGGMSRSSMKRQTSQLNERCQRNSRML